MGRKKAQDILELILKGERITEIVSTKRGKFVLAFPLPKDIRLIEADIARMLEGLPQNSFSGDAIRSFRAYATLDRIVIEGPEWWHELESAEDCPDDELIGVLYRRYLQLYRETQKSISKSGFRGNSEIGKARVKNAPVGDGLFSGITHGDEIQETDERSD